MIGLQQAKQSQKCLTSQAVRLLDHAFFHSPSELCRIGKNSIALDVHPAQTYRLSGKIAVRPSAVKQHDRSRRRCHQFAAQAYGQFALCHVDDQQALHPFPLNPIIADAMVFSRQLDIKQVFPRK